MKFVCDRCQTKYSIADDKVRGKVLKVRCKTCQNVITVREPGTRPSVNALAPVRPSQPRPSGAIATLGADEPEELGERTQLTTAPAALMAADLAKPRRATPPPPPPLGDGIEWFLALEGVQQGPFTQRGLVDRLLVLPKDADVHVWNERMDGWKPPKDVPPVAKELAARAAPALPMRPPVPRATPSPPVPPTAARRGTQPLTSGHGGKLPLPVAAVGAAHAVPTPASHPHLEDAAAALATPAPVAVPGGHGANGTNGIAHAGAAPGLPATGDTDALSALNLRGPSAKKSGPLRIMDPVVATAWEGQQSASGRGRGTKMVVAFLGVLGLIIVVVLVSMTKKPAPVAGTAPKNALDSESLGKLADNIAHEKVEPPPKTPPPTAPAEPSAEPQRTGHSHPQPAHGAHGVAGRMTAGGTTTTTKATTTTAEDPSAAHMRDSGNRNIAAAAAIANRPPPSQGDISRVINNNKIGIKTCYQRALLRDSNLTHGKIVVGLSIGISGRVKGVKVDGPPAFRALEPCIKEMVARWVFPQSYEEYGSEFSYVFQGSE